MVQMVKTRPPVQMVVVMTEASSRRLVEAQPECQCLGDVDGTPPYREAQLEDETAFGWTTVDLQAATEGKQGGKEKEDKEASSRRESRRVGVGKRAKKGYC